MLASFRAGFFRKKVIGPLLFVEEVLQFAHNPLPALNLGEGNDTIYHML